MEEEKENHRRRRYQYNLSHEWLVKNAKEPSRIPALDLSLIDDINRYVGFLERTISKHLYNGEIIRPKDDS